MQGHNSKKGSRKAEKKAKNGLLFPNIGCMKAYNMPSICTQAFIR